MTGFTNPSILWFLLLVPIIFYLYVLAMKKKKHAAIKFSALGLIKSASGGKKFHWRKHILFYITLAAIILIIVGFADPHIPLKRVKEGVNVVLVLDVSGSMQATDYQPNRLEAAKASAAVLLESLNEKDNVGIIVFESGATTAAYLSPFKERVMDKLAAIQLRQGKTALGDGLSLGIDMASSIPNKRKVIILLSDGVSNAGVMSPEEAVTFAKQNKIQVYTIGVGSKDQTVLGHDFFGNPVYAELDEETLKAIASMTGGQYFKSVDSGTLEDIYKKIGKDIKREYEETSVKDFFFLVALILLFVELYVRYGRYRILQ